MRGAERFSDRPTQLRPAAEWPGWDLNREVWFVGSRVQALHHYDTPPFRDVSHVQASILSSSPVQCKSLIPRIFQELITPFTGEAGPSYLRGFVSLAGRGHFRTLSTRRVMSRKRSLGTNETETVPHPKVTPWLTGPQFCSRGGPSPALATNLH